MIQSTLFCYRYFLSYFLMIKNLKKEILLTHINYLLLTNPGGILGLERTHLRAWTQYCAPYVLGLSFI